VTKVFPAETLREAYDLGLRDFGENYVQEFEGKAPLLADLKDARYHLIGHLQSNKSKKAAELFQVVQTVDSAKLARRLNESVRPLDAMLEVKLRRRGEKRRRPRRVDGMIAAVRACGNLRLLGLMTMPPWSDDPEASRGSFRQLREWLKSTGCPLSMGMSHDLETAIEEGSPAWCWDSAVRQAEEAVTSGSTLLYPRRAPVWPITPPRCWPR